MKTLLFLALAFVGISAQAVTVDKFNCSIKFYSPTGKLMNSTSFQDAGGIRVPQSPTFPIPPGKSYLFTGAHLSMHASHPYKKGASFSFNINYIHGIEVTSGSNTVRAGQSTCVSRSVCQGNNSGGGNGGGSCWAEMCAQAISPDDDPLAGYTPVQVVDTNTGWWSAEFSGIGLRTVEYTFDDKSRAVGECEFQGTFHP